MSTPVSRRSFIRTAGLGSVAAVAFPHILGAQTPGAPSPNNRLNVACVGVGGRGEAAIDGMKGENFVAFCDVDDERAAGTYRAYPDVPRFRDYRQMFEKMGSKIDAVTQRPDADPGLLPDPGDNRHIILVTAHRRENFDGGMQRIATALLHLAEREDVVIAFPVHPNPNVLEPMQAMLGDHPRIRLLPPQEYVPFVYLLSRCHFVLTDSGGVQEEAPALGKPVLVMRNTTERPEGVEAGTALLVGTDPALIAKEALRLLTNRQHYSRMSRAHNPFGDGQASQRIIDVLSREMSPANEKELKYAV